MKTTAIILAAGQGRRMGSDTAKQFLLLSGRPVLYYTLKNFEESIVDEIVLVTGEGQAAYCQKEIVEAFGFSGKKDRDRRKRAVSFCCERAGCHR